MGIEYKKHLCDLIRKRGGVHLDAGQAVFLNRNERVIPYDDSVIKLLLQRLAKVQFHLYPDIELFYQRLSHWLGVPEEQLFITEGVSGAIKSLMETTCRAGNNVIFPIPTFALYPVYCQMFNLESRVVAYSKDYKLDIAFLLRAIDKNTAIVFLPNPNVPIEGTLSLKEIEGIAQHCKKQGAILAIDEVYFPFGGPTAITLPSRLDNIIVMRSFSKVFGLAGIRLGYIIGSPKIIKYVSKMRGGYETNSVSAEITSFFIDNYHFVEEYIQQVKDGLAYLKEEFNKRNLEYNGGDTSNFIYLNLHNEKLIDRIVSELEKKHIYVRGGWPEPFSGGLSITGGPRKVMEKFIKELFPLLLI